MSESKWAVSQWSVSFPYCCSLDITWPTLPSCGTCGSPSASGVMEGGDLPTQMFVLCAPFISVHARNYIFLALDSSSLQLTDGQFCKFGAAAVWWSLVQGVKKVICFRAVSFELCRLTITHMIQRRENILISTNPSVLQGLGSFVHTQALYKLYPNYLFPL